MNCSNNLCAKPLATPVFTCEFCKDQHYCSLSCRTEDWDLGHSKVCEQNYEERAKKIEETCPFIKIGHVLTEEQANLMAPKGSDIYGTYEQVQIEGKPNSTLGKGSYGEVILMRHKEKKELVAMKVVDKLTVGSPSLLRALVSEIETQKKLLHENIIRLFAHVEDLHRVYIIMEYANKGTLYQLVRKKGKLTEWETFFFFTQTCSAIHFLHKHKLMHRDIKPENLLITDKGRLKVCDFGLCTPYDIENRRTFCGTIEYMAPEIIKREGYGVKADIWSLGVLLYEMLHGYAPFHGRRDEETISMIIENKITFASGIKDDAKDLVKLLLHDDPKARPSAIEIFVHPWMKRMQSESKIPDNTTKPSAEPAPVIVVTKDKEEKKEEVAKSPQKEESKKHRKSPSAIKGPIARSLVYSKDLVVKPQSSTNLPHSPEPKPVISPVPVPAPVQIAIQEKPAEINKAPSAPTLATSAEPKPMIEVKQEKEEEKKAPIPAEKPKEVELFEVDTPQLAPEVGAIFNPPTISRPEIWQANLESLLKPITEAMEEHAANGPDTMHIPCPPVNSGKKLEDVFAECWRGSVNRGKIAQEETRRNTKQGNRPTQKREETKHNLFHREDRRSRLTTDGFTTFHFVEEDPLYHVNKFLEEIASNPKGDWKKAMTSYEEQVVNMDNELSRKLIGRNDESKEDEENELNTSYTSDDYAFQRSETVMKAVNYLDEVDAVSFMPDSSATTERLTRERERLRVVCNSLQAPPSDDEKEEDGDEESFQKHRDNKDKKALASKANKPSPPEKKVEERKEDQTSVSVYKDSIKSIMDSLVKLDYDETSSQPRRSFVENVSKGRSVRRSVHGENVEPARVSTFWKDFFTFGGGKDDL